MLEVTANSRVGGVERTESLGRSVSTWFQLECERIDWLLQERLAAGETGAWVEFGGVEISAGSAAEKQADLIGRWLTSSESNSDPLGRLAELNEVERSVLCLALAAELDARLEQQMATMAGVRSGTGLNLATLERLFLRRPGEAGVMVNCLSSANRLQRLGMLRLYADSTNSEQLRLRAMPRWVSLANGSPVADPVVEALTLLHAPESGTADISPAIERQIAPYRDSLRAGDLGWATRSSGWPIIRVSGPAGSGKGALLRGLAGQLAHQLRELPLANLKQDDSLMELLDRVFDCAAAEGSLLWISDVDLCAERPVLQRMLKRRLRQRASPVFVEVDNDQTVGGWSELFDVTLRCGKPERERREMLLRERLPEVDGPEISRLAVRFDLRFASLDNASRLVSLANRTDRETLEHAFAQQHQAELSHLAERQHSRVSLDDLVLPMETFSSVLEVVDACRIQHKVLGDWGFGERIQKGVGLCVLLHGEPGTGKTHCAEVLANELGRALYRVSIPRVVSKWVGETERNIEQIFRVAKNSHSILLFDEADSLFANRTRVESAMDRYSNTETNYLLQQIEDYRGIVILTTNLSRNLDPAVERRIAFRVDFPFPDAAARARIWERLIPEKAPIEGRIDLKRLGQQFELAGGYIKNAVLRAAYRAASLGRDLSFEFLSDAAEAECRQSGRLVRTKQRKS